MERYTEMAIIDDKLKELGLEPMPLGADFVPFSTEEVAAIENAIGAVLPDDYRRFLAIYGASLDAALEGDGAERAEILRREAEIHPRLETIGELAREIGVETLVLTRLRPPPVYDFQYRSIVREDFPGRVVIADDGDEITP